MTIDRTSNADLQNLIDLFVSTAIEQEESHIDFDTKRFKALFWKMEKIEKLLMDRPGDGRTALVDLLQHPNAEVRLRAAKATLAVAPSQARMTLEQLRNSGLQPQAGEAGMCLWALDEGIFKPT